MLTGLEKPFWAVIEIETDGVISLAKALTVEGFTEIEKSGGGGAVTFTVAEPDLVISCAEIAVMVADPTPAGEKTPAVFTDPMLVGVTDHVTEEL
jgi:hypothetical protein